MLVAEGMNSRRSRRALVLCMAMREHGAGGAFSAIFIDVVELATIEPGVRADRLRRAAQLSRSIGMRS